MEKSLIYRKMAVLVLLAAAIMGNANAVEKENVINPMIEVSAKKPVFDSTKYRYKNPANKAFFIPITVLYVNQLLPNRQMIDIEHLIRLARGLPQSEIPVILDIEIWDVHTVSDIEANANIDKYIQVIDTMKKTRPDLKFGYYGVLPNRDYWSPVSNDPRKLAEWKRINDRLKRLAEHVDVVCPSLYTFYDDLNGWKKYARENIRRARDYGKPVYPFVWPQYHDSNRLKKGEFVDTRIWIEQLTLVQKESDGIIIWGGWNLDRLNYGPMMWDENAPWWQATKKFIQSAR